MGSEPATLGSSVPETEIDGLLHSPQMSSKTLISRSFSETDSVDLYIGPQFQQMGTNIPTFSDTANVSTPLPSQKLME